MRDRSQTSKGRMKLVGEGSLKDQTRHIHGIKYSPYNNNSMVRERSLVPTIIGSACLVSFNPQQ